MTATYLGSGDPARRRTDYFPVWLNDLADDVTLEASAINGAAQGPDAVRSIILAVKSLYEYQDINFTGDYGEAAAINELGRGTGLPIAVSADNSEWWWGPGNPDATTVVAISPGPVDVASSVGVVGETGRVDRPGRRRR